MKNKAKNITLSEQFQKSIGIHSRMRQKTIPLTHTHLDCSLSWLYRHFNKKWRG